ncbi:MAG TPA: SMI1/KNR4 family protein [Niastella sp.]
MDWIQFLSKEITFGDDRKLGFHEPAPQSLLQELKKQLNLTQLPPELEELYLQTNGIDDFLYIKQSDESIKMGHLIWSVERVIETNISKRTSATDKRIYKSFDNLFFFADAGNGDLYGFETRNGIVEKTDVYIWDHENDTREWLAPGMKALIEGWSTGAF